MEDERKDVVRDHEFDGIQEYDNSLPNWWLWTFALTVLFGLYWWTAKHTFAAPEQGSHAQYQEQMQAVLDLQAAKAGAGPTDEEVLATQADPAQLKAGAEVFKANCLACHGARGEGGIGPNLTDAYWIHGGRPSQLASVIINGVPDMGMVPWQGVLSSAQIRQVTAHVVSLKGSDPPGAKAPQGERVN
jgi:cytochrome c oxidase cbb3-type subunit 3